MFTKALTFSLSTFLYLNTIFAQDCMPDLSRSLPAIKIPDINLQVNDNSYFCFDIHSVKDKEVLRKFESLKDKGAFDESNCLIEKKFDSQISSEVTELIIATTKEHLKVYAADSANPSEKSLLIMTNSENKDFISKAISTSQLKLEDPNKLTTKDALEIGGAAAIGSLVGIVVQRQAFKNPDGSIQKDKSLHANYGALINIGSVAGSYLLIETAGLGDKLKMSKNQKKWAILLTGTVVGLLVGYGKERFYDYYRRDSHTYDPKMKGDMGATWLGGGAFNALGGSITFQF